MKTVFLVLLGLLTLGGAGAAQATVLSGELNTMCTASSPVCRSYVLGGAERFWLLHSKHEKCAEAVDTKALDTVMQDVSGKQNPFASAKSPEAPAAYTLLGYLISKKIEMCSLGMRFSDLLTKCVGKTPKDQNICQAYIAGVLDMAMAFDEMKQAKGAKKPEDVHIVPPFCEGGKPKDKMSDADVMGALTDWQKARPDRPTKAPAAQEIINALVVKYPCKKDNLVKDLK